MEGDIEQHPSHQPEYRTRWTAEKARQNAAFDAYKVVDKTGQRYKSEVLSYEKLLKLYFGIRLDDEKADEFLKDKTKRYRKRSPIRPSETAIFGEKKTFEQWLDLRARARKDLFWLGKSVLKKGLIEKTHRIVCDQFVQKNFDGCFPQGYDIDQLHAAIDRQIRVDEHGEDTKEMMLLDPRGFYKSTIDGIDCVQWMLAVPDIRILILTGEYKLALAFMGEIKGYFYFPDGSEPTDFHLIFPEYVLTGVEGTSKEPIWCPARQHGQKEPSLWVNSIDASLSGWHCDIRKTDDIVTDRNCNNEDTRLSLKEKADGTDNLLDEWGFSDYIGTRYWVDDYYGTRLKPDEDGTVLPIKYFCRQCWIVKPQYIDVPLKQLQSEMVVLTFPEKATWGSLKKKLFKNERSFRNQQLNEPTEADEDSAFKVTFTEDILRAHTYQMAAVPPGDTFICWDWAFSHSKSSDWSVGVAGRVYQTRVRNELLDREEMVYGISFMEVNFGRWKPSELAYQIVSFDKKWHPKQTLIEKSNGAELLQMEVQRNAVRYGVSLNIYWKPVVQQPDAKRNRIKGLETLLIQDRLWFVGGNWIDETYKQLTSYTGERGNRGRKDDIPDAMSFFSFFLPSTEFNEDKMKMEEEQFKQAVSRQQYQRLFGGESIAQPVENTEAQPSLDPRMKIFGGNGLHI